MYMQHQTAGLSVHYKSQSSARKLRQRRVTAGPQIVLAHSEGGGAGEAQCCRVLNVVGLGIRSGSGMTQ